MQHGDGPVGVAAGIEAEPDALGRPLPAVHDERGESDSIRQPCWSELFDGFEPSLCRRRVRLSQHSEQRSHPTPRSGERAAFTYRRKRNAEPCEVLAQRNPVAGEVSRDHTDALRRHSAIDELAYAVRHRAGFGTFTRRAQDAQVRVARLRSEYRLGGALRSRGCTCDALPESTRKCDTRVIPIEATRISRLVDVHGV